MSILGIFTSVMIIATLTECQRDNHLDLKIAPYRKSHLLCSANCTYSRSCRPQLRVLAQSSDNQTSLFGRMLRIEKRGTIVVMCFIDSIPNAWIIKSFLALELKEIRNSYAIDYLSKYEGFEIREIGQDLMKSTNFLNPRIDSIIQNQTISQYRVVCSNSYPLNQTQQLDLLRVYPNGTKISIKIDPLKIFASLSEDGQFINLKYQEEFTADLDYFRNTYECETMDSFTLAFKSVILKQPILIVNGKKKCEDSFQITKTIRFTKILNNIPILDSVDGFVFCSCDGSIPAAKIYWEDSTGVKLFKSRLNINEGEADKQPYCCIGQQNIQNGQIILHKSCLTISPIGLLTNSSQDKDRGIDFSGVYWIGIESNKILKAFVDLTVSNQCWIIVQRRMNKTSKFDKSWIEYKNGFGELMEDFWLGNDKLHQLTGSTPRRVRFDIWSSDNEHRFAEYSHFSVADEKEKFKLTISGYSGDAGDSMKYHNGMRFSTRDQDNDDYSGDCSRNRQNGGWWFNECDKANFNGIMEWESASIEVTKSEIRILYL